MTKRLILFRHAKSAWNENVEDHERSLAARGIAAAPVMGRWLAAQGLVPDLALVSTARRARQTWTLASAELGTPVDKQDSAAIYEASPEDIMRAIRSVPASVGTLIVVGHNPGLEELAKRLMSDGGGEAGARLREKFPTGAIAVLACRVEAWSSLAPGASVLESFVTPKMLA